MGRILGKTDNQVRPHIILLEKDGYVWREESKTKSNNIGYVFYASKLPYIVDGFEYDGTTVGFEQPAKLAKNNMRVVRLLDKPLPKDPRKKKASASSFVQGIGSSMNLFNNF